MIGRQFSRIAIVNRGEPAMRLIHAVRELNGEQNAGLRTVAIYTEADAHSMYVREADESMLLGPAMFDDARDGRRKSTYLDHSRVMKTLAEARAEAVWVGWGFVAEDAMFAELCAKAGLIFIGPSAAVMRILGDKIAAKRVAEKAKIPVVPWSKGPVEDLNAAVVQAEEIGYPIMLKAAAGGGGRGIRRVDRPSELEEAFSRARSEALAAFGSDQVFLEKRIDAVRHVEVQVVADRSGNVWAVGSRDCSVQRRNQKVMEEAPSPVVSESLDRALRDAAVRLSREAGYENVGTVEFLLDPKTQTFWFMEMNTRLQVEHPVTEMTTGVDLVKLQLHVANGGELQGQPPRTVGHAIEVRLNAEDPDRGFAPSPGKILRLDLPQGPGLRVDTGVGSSDGIAAEFDSMIAKIIAYGANRNEALGRLRRALVETAVVIDNGTTNKALLLELARHQDFQNGNVDTSWLDRIAPALRVAARPHADVALLVTGVLIYLKELEIERTEYMRTAVRGRPSVREEPGLGVDLVCEGHKYNLIVSNVAGNRFDIRVDNVLISMDVREEKAYEHQCRYNGQRYRIISSAQNADYLVEVDGVIHRVTRNEGGLVRAPSPALVVAVEVKEGAIVNTGGRLMVLEAMKTEILVAAPGPGRVHQVFVSPNTQVPAGAPLLSIDSNEEVAPVGATPRIVFTPTAMSLSQGSDPRDSCLRALNQIRQFVLGFDVSPNGLEQALREYRATRASVVSDDAGILEGEDQILAVFADALLLRSETPVGEERLSAGECLRRYLSATYQKGKGLPQEFMTRLKRALSRYGLEDLSDAPRLGDVLLRLHKSYLRSRMAIDSIVIILEQKLSYHEASSIRVNAQFNDTLENLLEATRERSLAIHDLALQIRFRTYYQPIYEEAKANEYLRLEASLGALLSSPDLDSQAHLRENLVSSSVPIAGLLASHIQRNPTAVPAVLSILVEMFYPISQRDKPRFVQIGDLTCLGAAFTTNEQSRYVIAILAPCTQLQHAAHAVSTVIQQMPQGLDIVVDFHLISQDELTEPQEVCKELLEEARKDISGRIPGRICCAFLPTRRLGNMDCLTFAWRNDRYEEVEQYRGIHPMQAGSLGIWRLRNFNATRLASPESIYAFHATGRTNAKDERLFVFADVREVEVTGQYKAGNWRMPHFEHKLLEALSCIRSFQYRRPRHKRLQWNRVMLDLSNASRQPTMEAVCAIVERIAVDATNLGLEEIVVNLRQEGAEKRGSSAKIVELHLGVGNVVRVEISNPTEEPIHELTPYTQKVVRLRSRGMTYPYEIIRMLTPPDKDSATRFPPGHFSEYDLDEEGQLSPVKREYGLNSANMIVGILTNHPPLIPEGMSRVVLFGDPSREMGALAEPECRRVIAALDLAENLRLPVDWYPISAGAKISMDSGTENLDWTARVLRRIIEFTEAGGEINVVIDGVNVGAQSYWNAEATMLMHTRGILVMTPNASMVLTGKQALEYSGSVSAEDNRGIGGGSQIMGPNGEAQYLAQNLVDACEILLRYHEYTYVVPGEHGPRRHSTTDAFDRDVTQSSHEAGPEGEFSTVGEIFSFSKNPQRKKGFHIRSVMRSVVDQDCTPLERWGLMRDAEMAVTWEARIGGFSTMLIGFESHPMSRGGGFIAGDGPDTWTGGTLFPLSSKKVARAIHAASGNRPVVVLANLSGFDGSPESMRKLQLEYGAEIGRAVVKFCGPLIFCVISRYHGGAYVVFSQTLNERLHAVALEGSHASVIGGAPAAAVVFTREVEERVYQHRDVKQLQNELRNADERSTPRIQTELAECLKAVRAKIQGELAEHFDSIHSVERAKQVGSIGDIIPASRLRPFVIEAIELVRDGDTEPRLGQTRC